MAGGKGTRFWPLSVEQKPKQFTSIYSKRSMIQETYERFKEWLPENKIFVVTTEDYLDLILEHLPNMDIANIILEPAQRDTAPCIALTAKHFINHEDNEVLIISPSDQFITNDITFKDSLLKAEKVASEGLNIVTLGITPTRPETGYGYMETYGCEGDYKEFKVKKFIEKPTLEKAELLYNQENIFWNSGTFIVKPSTIAHYMKEYHSEIWSSLDMNNLNFKKNYSLLPKLSFDYAILERAETIYSIPVRFDWDDLGTWKSLERCFDRTAEGNIIFGNVSITSTNDCTIYSENEKQVIVLGVQDIIIVNTNDGVLVCHKKNESQLKDILKSLDD